MTNNWPDNLAIQQYLNGSLDRKLMHELEKRSLEDPFLADALEGFTQIPGTDYGLSILQRQLHERITHQHENKKVFNLSWQRLSIAAAAAVMFITGGVLFWMNSYVREQKVAGNQKQVEVKVTPIDSLIQNRNVGALSSQKIDKIELAEGATLNRPNQAVRLKIERKMAGSPSISSIRSQKVTNKSLETVIPDKQANIYIAARAKKVAGIAWKDSASTKSVRVLKTQPLSEMTINSLAGDTQHKAARANGIENYKNNIEEHFFKASPDGGWEAYRTYLKENIARKATPLKQKGKVVIGFKVNQLGDLTDFKILKGLSASADSLAVQLIKTGRAWKTLPEVKVADLKIEIDF